MCSNNKASHLHGRRRGCGEIPLEHAHWVTRMDSRRIRVPWLCCVVLCRVHIHIILYHITSHHRKHGSLHYVDKCGSSKACEALIHSFSRPGHT